MHVPASFVRIEWVIHKWVIEVPTLKYLMLGKPEGCVGYSVVDGRRMKKRKEKGSELHMQTK